LRIVAQIPPGGSAIVLLSSARSPAETRKDGTLASSSSAPPPTPTRRSAKPAVRHRAAALNGGRCRDFGRPWDSVLAVLGIGDEPLRLGRADREVFLLTVRAVSVQRRRRQFDRDP
jgi:hypothetical protein